MCLSAILSSAPTNVAEVESEFVRLIQEIASSSAEESKTEAELAGVVSDHRLPEMPRVLEGRVRRRQIGMDGRVRRYPATRPRPPPPPAGAARMPPAMITRGEHDFVSESSVAGVARFLQRGGSRGKYMTLSGCSHPRPCRRTGRRIHGERSWIRSFGEYG